MTCSECSVQYRTSFHVIHLQLHKPQGRSFRFHITGLGFAKNESEIGWSCPLSSTNLIKTCRKFLWRTNTLKIILLKLISMTACQASGETCQILWQTLIEAQKNSWETNISTCCAALWTVPWRWKFWLYSVPCPYCIQIQTVYSMYMRYIVITYQFLV